MKKSLLVFFLGFTLFSSKAQDDVLFTIGNEPVKLSEFEYIYNKNNFSGANKYSKKSVDDYLDLYINFRLKLKEATELGLFNNNKFKEEFATYENQLINNYVEKEVLDKVLLQEYERSKTDVSLSHIFVPFYNDSTKTIADKKIKAIYEKIKSGKSSFEIAAKESEDKNTNTKDGYLGWFNSYQIILPELENVAYTLKPKEISAPFQSKYGYHILKLNDTRPARPMLRVAIIKKNILNPNDPASVQALRDTMQKIYHLFKSGTPFNDLVQNYTDDENSKQFGGKIDWFGIHYYTPVFEEAAYSIKKIGDISEPVETKLAFYLIQKIDETKPKSFEEEKTNLRSKLLVSDIYEQAMQSFLNTQKSKYNFIAFNNNIYKFKQHLNNLIGNTAFKYKDTIPNNILYKIGNQDFDQNKIGKAIEKIYYSYAPKNTADSRIDVLYDEIEKENILAQVKADIRSNNEEYKQLINEYKNGIMIFDLSEQKIWNKASSDTAGLKQFYNTHAADFLQKATYKERNITISQSKSAKKIYKIILSNPNISNNVLKDKLSLLDEKNTTIDEITHTVSSNNAIDMSIKKPIKKEDKFVITQQYQYTPQQPKPYDEIKGYVIAAYQEQLEENWINDLKAKYTVKINEPVLNKIIKH